jgi:hypothetical protein
MKDELKRYICIPFAIKLFREDKEMFRSYKMENVYLDKLNAVIKQLQKDFYKMKGTYHAVRKIEEGKYRFGGEVYEFDLGELRKETTEIMKEYLFTVESEYEERVWPDADDRYKG